MAFYQTKVQATSQRRLALPQVSKPVFRHTRLHINRHELEDHQEQVYILAIP